MENQTELNLKAAVQRWRDHLRRTLQLLLLTGVGLGLTQGCSSRTGGSSAQTPAEQSMALWNAGKKDAATEKFMSVDWKSGNLFSSGSILNYSEKQFAEAPQAEKEKLDKQMKDDLQTLKAVCSRVNNLGREAMEKGDKARAEQYFQQLLNCGEALDQPERTQLTQLVGQGLKRISSKELSALKR